jgi:hypothetical protein
MTVYLAGAAKYEYLRGRPMLESFWYRSRAVDAMLMTDTFFLDSGAFTAFTKGAQIDLKQYAEFIRQNKKRITIASSLDVIGDAEGSYRAYRQLRDEEGVDVIPVFHCREDKKWLVKYIKEGARYIALGGMVPESISWLFTWLDDLYSTVLTDDSHKPIVRVHGFGLTVGRLIERYPWYSVDSTTWLNGARFGTVIFNFPGARLEHIAVSDRNPMAKQRTALHIDRLSRIEQAQAIAQLERAGFTLDEVRSNTSKALEFSAWSFQTWEKDYGFPKQFLGAKASSSTLFE